MKLRIAGRHDSLLLAGFAFALLVVFQRSLQYLFGVAYEIEKTYGVALVPALLILTVMFVFHLYSNRREMRAEALASAREAELARARTGELEQLMTFAQALSRALTHDAIHEAVWRHLPILANGAETWLVVRRDGEWERVTDRGHARWREGEIEEVADAVMDRSPEELVRPDGVLHGAFVCYTVEAGERTCGVIGLTPVTAGPETRRTIATAATLVGIALRNV